MKTHSFGSGHICVLVCYLPWVTGLGRAASAPQAQLFPSLLWWRWWRWPHVWCMMRERAAMLDPLFPDTEGRGPTTPLWSFHWTLEIQLSISLCSEQAHLHVFIFPCYTTWGSYCLGRRQNSVCRAALVAWPRGSVTQPCGPAWSYRHSLSLDSHDEWPGKTQTKGLLCFRMLITNDTLKTCLFWRLEAFRLNPNQLYSKTVLGYEKGH